MLYETLSQPIIFFIMSTSGFLTGFLFDIKDIFLHFIKRKKIISQILLFFAVFCTFFEYFIANLWANFGEIRFFTIFAFSLALFIQRFLSKNFLAKPFLICYNKLKEKYHGRKKGKMVEKI